MNSLADNFFDKSKSLLTTGTLILWQYLRERYAAKVSGMCAEGLKQLLSASGYTTIASKASRWNILDSSGQMTVDYLQIFLSGPLNIFVICSFGQLASVGMKLYLFMEDIYNLFFRRQYDK